MKKQLEYKSEWYGNEFKVVDEKYTSKTCNLCGFINDDLKLSTIHWMCSDRGTQYDKNVNAAINIQM